MTTNLKMIERIPLEILNKGDLGLVDEIYATDYVERTGLAGRADDSRWFQADREGASDGVPRSPLHDR